MTQALSKGEILHRLSQGDNLKGLSLVRADLSAMELAYVDLTQANLRMANLTQANLSEARLMGSFLSGATLTQAHLVGASLIQASMIGAILNGADLSRADLSGADLTGANLEEAMLSGAFLVGAFLTETNLTKSYLAGAYVRMSQMAGCNLMNAVLESADLSQSDLSGARLDGASLNNASLSGAKLSACSLVGCDLREADLTNADLSGCNLTGAKLHGIKYTGVNLTDTWADWVDISVDGNPLQQRATLEDAFVGVLTRPLAQIFVEGAIPTHVWALLISHLCEFQSNHPNYSDIQLKGIHKGANSSALYLEAEREASLVAYFKELSEIVGKGARQLSEKLSFIKTLTTASLLNGSRPLALEAAVPGSPTNGASAVRVGDFISGDDPLGLGFGKTSFVENLQTTSFWGSEKGFVILTGSRQIYLEAVSSPLLTMHPPHNTSSRLDLVQGHFVPNER
jgi:uncharacterized protein YjbI with pentapeptide repeats